MNGYGGKILAVNLTNGSTPFVILDPEVAKGWIGGRGFASAFLYYAIEKGTAPFSPENAVVMASGPLSGTFVPAAGKVHFATKSPLTGGYGDSNMGGHIAAEMKYAGFDAIIIIGKSKRPCYLFIQDDEVQIREAKHLWGRGAIETEKLLKEELGQDFQIAVIGPAGEKKVSFACISHDFGRQAGRCGIGAVLGSKNLKAIAVKGTKGIKIADFDEMVRQGKKMFSWCQEQPFLKIFQRCGTPVVTEMVNQWGSLPINNFKTGHSDQAKNLHAETMRKEVVIHDKACFACPMACGKYSRAKTEKFDVYVEGPEYETIALCGSNCGIFDIKEVAYANYLCDELGIDTISGGGAVAFAIECFEKGIITKEDTDGLELKFGDIQTFEYLIKKIALKDDSLGKLLAKGVKAASRKLGKGSKDFAIQVKGLEWSGYESRDAMAMLLSYLTSDNGAHHSRAWAITKDIELGRSLVDGKAEIDIYLQHIRPMFDMLGVCRFTWVELGIEPETYPQILKAVTGNDYALDDLLKASERVWTLNRAFWFREIKDFGRKYDMPPARFYKEPVPTGPTAGKMPTLETINRLLDDYYKLRGWDENGKPTKEKLIELNLEFLIPDLY
ncbi:MAG: aldehyde ferredoxin oxidoreductase family protein [Candidatus Nealsonbacteria bacterium]|nr:aldehyde ferredoxin oxidoreductase family protein [Candidatus Nealsonbacteria bacterium]